MPLLPEGLATMTLVERIQDFLDAERRELSILEMTTGKLAAIKREYHRSTIRKLEEILRFGD